MISYRFMRMEMDGNRDGTDRVSTADVLADFPVTPTEMTMDMHMVGLMYTLSERWTFMAMVPYLDISMDHVTRMGVEFTTRTSGLGDVQVSGLYELWERPGKRLLFNAGLSVPTGSIDEEDETPASMGEDVQLPYPMQLGSGTWDLRPGLTFSSEHAQWSWGSQFRQTLRLGQNDEDYRLGNRSELNGWIARRLSASTSASLRLSAARWGDIHGNDNRLNPAMVPTADPDLRGGLRVDLSAGLSVSGRQGLLAGHRLGFEVGVPIYQDLDGPQLETDLLLTIGWQYTR